MIVASLLVAAELILRAFGYANYEQYLPHAELLWTLKPGQRSITHFGHQPVKVNSQGMRGDEFPLDKPPGKIRIISFGDSYTYGYGVGQDETYPAQLARLLEERFPGRYEVLNAGVNGYGTYQELIALRQALRYQPDIVTISSTYNDSVLLGNVAVDGTLRLDEAAKERIVRSVGLKSIARSVALYNFGMEKVAKWLYWRVKDRLVTGTWSTEYPVDPMRGKYRAILGETLSTGRAHGISMLFVIPHWGDLGPYGEIMVQLAKEERVPYMYMSPIYRHYRQEDVFFLDHGHPTALGNRLIALELLKLVSTLTLVATPGPQQAAEDPTLNAGPR